FRRIVRAPPRVGRGCPQPGDSPMTVRVRFLPGLVIAPALVLALTSGAARAQYGYPVGRYGFGGWGGGSTVQGDIARGLGNLAAGAGAYNEQTAVANSINADTVMRLNHYIYA